MTVINTNVKSLVAQNAASVNNRSLSKAMEQLSTGKRINSAADDAAGLAISSKMTSQIRGLNQAVRNANDAISLIQVAEGSLVEVTNMMQRMRELSVQSANDTNTTEDRDALDLEFQQLKTEINRISNNTQWNGMNLLDSSFQNGSGQFTFQIGANAEQVISVSLNDFRTTNRTNVPSLTFVQTTPAADAEASQPASSQVTKFAIANVDENDVFTINVKGTPYSETATNTSDEGDVIDALVLKINAGSGTHGVTASAGTGGDLGKLILTGANDGTAFTASATDNGNVIVASTSPGSAAVAAVTATAREATLAFGNGTYKAGDTISVGTNFSYTVTGLEENLASAFETAVSSAASPGFNASSSPSGVVTLTASTTGLGGAFANPTLSLATESPSALSMLINTDISTRNSANNAIEQLDLGLQAVSEGRAELGATINRLTYAADNLTNVSQNTSESRSRILDTDYAQTTTELARTQIISQAATAMLAQANQAPQSVLSLLR